MFSFVLVTIVEMFLIDNWNNGKLIAFISLGESLLKFSLAIIEMIFGHLKNSSPNETRGKWTNVKWQINFFLIYFITFAVYIHSTLYTIFGVAGLICGLLLLNGLTNHKKYQRMIYWICFQGISIFHQMFFSIEVFVIVNHHARFWLLNMTLSVLLILALTFEILFMSKILKIYQSIDEKEAVAVRRTTPSWRAPTVSELLGDMEGNARSTPPIFAITNTTNNSSTAWDVDVMIMAFIFIHTKIVLFYWKFNCVMIKLSSAEKCRFKVR